MIPCWVPNQNAQRTLDPLWQLTMPMCVVYTPIKGNACSCRHVTIYWHPFLAVHCRSLASIYCSSMCGIAEVRRKSFEAAELWIIMLRELCNPDALIARHPSRSFQQAFVNCPEEVEAEHVFPTVPPFALGQTWPNNVARFSA